MNMNELLYGGKTRKKGSSSASPLSSSSVAAVRNSGNRGKSHDKDLGQKLRAANNGANENMNSIKSKGSITVLTTPEDIRKLNSSGNGNTNGLDTTKPYFVLVHAPWCFYCRNLRPEWDKMAEAMRLAGMQIIEIDLSVIPEARQQGSRLLEAVEKGSPVTTVPNISLVINDKDGKHVRTVPYNDSTINSQDYDKSEELRPRSAVHMMEFIERELSSSSEDKKK